MAKCEICNKEFDSCYLCRGQYNHQQCVDDRVCHQCYLLSDFPKYKDLILELDKRKAKL